MIEAVSLSSIIVLATQQEIMHKKPELDKCSHKQAVMCIVLTLPWQHETKSSESQSDHYNCICAKLGHCLGSSIMIQEEIKHWVPTVTSDLM